MTWCPGRRNVKRTMRTPIRSEREAFRFVFASVALIVVSVLVGWLAKPLVGVAVFAIAVVLAAIAYLRAENPDRRTVLRDAAEDPHPHGGPAGTRHILVVANEVLAGDELHTLISRAEAERVEVDVLAPVLTSHLHYAVSDIDSGLADARMRLDRSLAWAHQCGIVARGEVGDPDPTTAIADELRDFGADEVIVVTHPRERESWQEQGELERLRRELDVPVTHVMVGTGSATGATATEHGTPPPADN
jgi:hypothetical protein